MMVNLTDAECDEIADAVYAAVGAHSKGDEWGNRRARDLIRAGAGWQARAATVAPSAELPTEAMRKAGLAACNRTHLARMLRPVVETTSPTSPGNTSSSGGNGAPYPDSLVARLQSVARGKAGTAKGLTAEATLEWAAATALEQLQRKRDDATNRLGMALRLALNTESRLERITQAADAMRRQYLSIWDAVCRILSKRTTLYAISPVKQHD